MSLENGRKDLDSSNLGLEVDLIRLKRTKRGYMDKEDNQLYG